MATTHTLPSSLWNSSLSLDVDGLVATEGNFQPLVRQHNTMVSSGAPLFHVATLLPPVGSSETFYFEVDSKRWGPVNQFQVLRQRVLWDTLAYPDGEALLIEDETGEIETCDDAWFLAHPNGLLNLSRPLDGFVRFSYQVSVDQPDGTVAFSVVPTPPGAQADSPWMEADGYLADARAVAGRGVSVGVMQRMQDGIKDVIDRPIGVTHVAYCPTLDVGKNGGDVLPGIPYYGRGKAIGLSARATGDTNPTLILLCDGVEVARLDGFPASLSTETPMERSTPSAAIPAGWHRLSVGTDIAVTDAIHLVSLSIYEVE